MTDTAIHTRPRFRYGLADASYREESFPALRLARASRLARRIAQGLLVLFGLSILAMLFAPWQQTVSGSGSVVAFTPLDRRQVVEAPIKGRIVRWGEAIRENSYVEEGQFILEIQDVDPLLLERLQRQLGAGERELEASGQRLAAVQTQLEASRTIVEAYDAQLTAFTEVKKQVVAAAEEYIGMAVNKLEAEQKKLVAARAAREQAEADYERQNQLYEEGLASQLKMQLAQRKFREELAKQEQAASYVAAARDELEAKQRERDAKEREAQAKIDSTRAMQRKATTDVAKLEGELAKASGDVNKVEKELVNLQVKLARQQSQVVHAPRSGRIMRLIANQGGEFVKDGDPLFELVPDAAQHAVQIWVDGNDAPLIDVGRHVRLQFEGWPAVQFSGWPSVAVGTFGGEVALVDPTDDGRGRFRVVVLPAANDQPWPEAPYLRQGARANGWVLLDRVPLGYELWRRMNGFPPALKSREEEPGEKSTVPEVKIGGRAT